MTPNYPDLGSTSYWLKICFNHAEAIRSTTQISMARPLDIISQAGHHWWHYKVSAVLSCLSDQLVKKVMIVKQTLL